MSLVLAVIPARYASTRFPGKPLAPLGGRTLIEEVWSRASSAEKIDRLVVATDDQRILDASAAFGAEAHRTSRRHLSGTDRVAEIVRSIGSDYDIVLNIQGDEPLITPRSLDLLVDAFCNPQTQIATLVEAVECADDLFDPNVVKVVMTDAGRALYFSRAPIPFHRGRATDLSADFRSSLGGRPNGLSGYLKHQGIYAYRRDVLLQLTRLAPSTLETDEGLEQLRALQAGFSIQLVQSNFRSLAVDTPADLERVNRILTETETR